MLGLAFITCALLVAGLPPLAGFLAKVALLSAAIGPNVDIAAGPARWALVVLLLLSSAFATISLTRAGIRHFWRSEEHTSELQSLMRISYAVFCLKKKNKQTHITRKQIVR